MTTQEVLEKWKELIQACKNYYIDSLPTGISDSEYDEMEKEAQLQDGFYVRDYIFSTYVPAGTKSLNKYVDKIQKTKVKTTMLQSISDVVEGLGETCYMELKYDGTSLAIYLDPSTGKPLRIVTVGNLKLENYGVDQTWKLLHLLPPKFPKGILAIQAEALVDTNSMRDLDPERARQKANGLINSKYLADEVDELLTIRAYRYWCDDSEDGRNFASLDYSQALKSFPTQKNKYGNISFAPADLFTLENLKRVPEYCESSLTVTPTGSFLNDGWVIYKANGTCWGALKYSGAGSDTEIPTTTVQSIQWNDQAPKGKDSWSANVIVDPIVLRGCTVKKPSAGSVSKLVKNNISKGAKVKVILANSTIPMVGDVISGGDGDFQFPTCSCGYKLSEHDIFGSNLKCGNPECSSRKERMEKYLAGLKSITSLDLNKFLVIDRFKWENTSIDINKVLEFVTKNNEAGLKKYLRKEMTTALQQRNFDLVFPMAWLTLRESYLACLP